MEAGLKNKEIFYDDLLALREDAKSLKDFWQRQQSMNRSGEIPYNLRGSGMIFEELRPYQAGDDMRHVDWRAMARTGKLFSKVFCPEYANAVWLFADTHESMHFGSRRVMKSVLAAQAATLLAFCANDLSHAVGGGLLSAKHATVFQPRSNQVSLLPWLGQLANYIDKPSAYSADKMLEQLKGMQQSIPRDDKVMLFTDLIFDDDAICSHLAELSISHQLYLFWLYDPFEQNLPAVKNGFVTEAGLDGYVKLQQHQAAEALYHKQWNNRVANLKKLEDRGVFVKPLCTKDDVLSQLTQSMHDDIWAGV
jgi:uncharacterized protein (DUF58 family)